MTTTTTQTPRPSWAVHPDARTEVERGAKVHPDDAGVKYSRVLDGWQERPPGHWITPQQLAVEMYGFRHDSGDDEPDIVQVFHGDVPELDGLTAVDARRLGEALIRAADLMEGGEQR